MSVPRLVDVFAAKQSIDGQHWTSNGKRYNIGRLYHWAQERTEPQPIALSVLRPGFDRTNTDEEKGSPEFWERAENAGEEPILVAVDAKGRWWIADGNHRFARHERDGLSHISGYVVDEDDLPEDAIEPKK